jgi:glycosyltransferase involved in cell wall biosynthesis
MKISVIIPAYNAAAYIERAIGSVLAQTRPADEIIVVDDGSKDNTADIVRSFADKVKLISQANAGVSAARNAGIRAATGDWIAFLDADDEWLPDFLKAQTRLLSRNPHLVWSMANFFTCSSTENKRSPFTRPEKIEMVLRGKDFVDDYLVAFRYDIRGHLDTTIIRRDILIKEGFFDVNLSVAEDLDLWWKLAYHYPQTGFIAGPLAIYNFTASESLTKQQTEISFYINLIQRHLILSGQNNRQDIFKPVAGKMLDLWIRGMLFDARGRDIRQLLEAFPQLYPGWYRMWITLLTVFPGFTAAACRGISRVVRTLNLRRRVVAPPRPTQK